MCKCLLGKSENACPQRGCIQTYYYFLCVCVDVCPLEATEAPSISTRRTSVEAPWFHLHSTLFTSKADLCSWSLVVAYVLWLPGRGLWTNWKYRRVPGTRHQVRTIHQKTEYIYEKYRFCTGSFTCRIPLNGYINAYIAFVTYLWRTWGNICIHLVVIISYASFHLLFTVYTIF